MSAANILPRIQIKNPWIPPENLRERCSLNPHLWYPVIEVEVLTVHFKKNTMRVRTNGFGIRDMPATEFFEQFQFTPIEK